MLRFEAYRPDEDIDVSDAVRRVGDGHFPVPEKIGHTGKDGKDIAFVEPDHPHLYPAGGVDGYATRHGNRTRGEVKQELRDMQRDGSRLAINLTKKGEGFLPLKLLLTDGEYMIRMEPDRNAYEHTDHSCPQFGDGGRLGVRIENIIEDPREVAQRVDKMEDEEPVHPTDLEALYPYTEKDLVNRLNRYDDGQTVAQVSETGCMARELEVEIRDGTTTRRPRDRRF